MRARDLNARNVVQKQIYYISAVNCGVGAFMKTYKLYYDDAYLDNFSATVLSCESCGENYSVVLDKTAFFPEEGGQYADSGTLTGNGSTAEVLAVKEKDGVIVHTTDQPFAVASTVKGMINFDERFEKMQCHSGEHIVSGLIFRHFGLENVGFHLGHDDVTLDFNAKLSDDDLAMIEAEANAAVWQNIKIRTEFPDPETLRTLDYRSKLELTENVRIVTIENIDVCACCAVHVARTGEIGIIKLLDRATYKGGIRIHMLCGKRALADYEKRYRDTLGISNLLSVKQGDVRPGVERVLGEIGKYKASLSETKKALLEARVGALSETNDAIISFESTLDSGSAREYVSAAAAKSRKFAAVFIKNSSGYSYVIGSKHYDMRELSKNMNASLNGRGGGTAALVCGSVFAERGEIEKFFKETVQ